MIESLLMLRTKQVVDSLNRVEGLDRYLNEDCVPIAHGTIPQAWQLERFQLTAILALIRDEAGILVDIVGQVVFLALVILQATNQIDRIEVCSFLEERLFLRIVHIDL